MADHTHIEWTDATWNPVTGCSVVSPGCANCYAMRLAGTRLRHHPSRRNLTQDSNAGPVWTGQVNFNEEWIDQPLRWQKPRRIFVCAHGDLFHESVPVAWIDRVFAVMALCPQHTFQCLTKRASRMRAYCEDPGVTHHIAQALDAVRVDREHDAIERWAPVPGWETYEASTHGAVRRDGQLLQQILNSLYHRPSITLWKANEPRTVYVHTLVLSAHRGSAPEGTEARHRNGNRQDNRLANLEWATGAINQADKVRHGANGGPAKITREQAAEIRVLRKTGRTQQSLADQFGVSRSLISMIESRNVWADALGWPLPNCWLGVSVEDQVRANERIPELLATPAAVRFISAEPLLGDIDLRGWATHDWRPAEVGEIVPRLDWVIVGGESGPGARPMHPAWARSLRDQCATAGVAFFLKQWGEWAPSPDFEASKSAMARGWGHLDHHLFGDGTMMDRIGKKAAGRQLDGRTWEEFP